MGSKYVLSVLSFTYPTVYQGWQTLVGAFVLLYLRPSLFSSSDESTKLTCGHFLKILPNLLLYTASIICNSKALSTVPVPLYICAQNTISICVLLCTLKNVPLFDVIVSITGLLSSLFLFIYASFMETYGYHPWAIFFIIVTTILELSNHGYESNSREMSKLYYRNIFSFIILMPCSLYLGEAFSALQFKYLHQIGFYGCCFVSGIGGIFLQLSALRLMKTKQLQFNSSLMRIPTLIISLILFESDSITMPLWLLITVQCISTTLFTYSSFHNENKISQESLI